MTDSLLALGKRKRREDEDLSTAAGSGCGNTGAVMVIVPLSFRNYFPNILGRARECHYNANTEFNERFRNVQDLRLTFEIELQNVYGGHGISLPECRRMLKD